MFCDVRLNRVGSLREPLIDDAGCTSGRAVRVPSRLASFSDLETVVHDEFRAIPQVENIRLGYEEGTVFVWIGANNPVRPLRHEIYAKQMEFIEAFPEVSFDFNLIPGT